VKHAIWKHVHPESRLVTDGAQYYLFVPVQNHESVNHSRKEYVRERRACEHSGRLFQRVQARHGRHLPDCGEQHLQRYLAEFDFRANHRAKLGYDDNRRAATALQGIKGKRLTYRRPHQAGNDPSEGGSVHPLA
jgi:galactokinase